MRVAVVHSFYRSGQPSGENVAVEQQIQALENAGVEIVPVFRRTDDEAQRRLYGVRSALRLATGWDGGRLNELIQRVRPDVVQVHNTLPNFGTRWLAGLEIPVVTTLHNFRYACANGLLFRDGHVCLDCPTRGSLQALRHRCYQDSFAASLPAAIATSGGVTGNRVLLASKVVVTQSRRVHEFMLDSGVPEGVLAYVPGFVERRSGDPAPPPDAPRFVFVGRLSPEKGLEELIRLWPSRFPLDVFGGEAGSHPPSGDQIVFRGRLDRDELVPQLRGYTALVFPGLVWEGAYPLVVREALEAGVPVVAREGSGAADLVVESGAGIVYAGGDDASLDRALEEVTLRNEELRSAARRFFEASLTEEQWVAATIRAYQHARGVPNDG